MMKNHVATNILTQFEIPKNGDLTTYQMPHSKTPRISKYSSVLENLWVFLRYSFGFNMMVSDDFADRSRDGKTSRFPGWAVWFQAEAARDSEDQILPPRVGGKPSETKAVLGGWKKILYDMLIVRNGMVIPNWLWYMAIGQHYQSSKGIVSYCLNKFNAKKAAF